jgi:hypothetical protein
VTLTALAVVAVFICLASLAFARHPSYGAMLYILLVYVNPPGRWWGAELLPGFRWSVVAVVLTFLALLIHKSRMSGPLVSIFRQQFIWVFFAFVG